MRCPLCKETSRSKKPPTKHWGSGKQALQGQAINLLHGAAGNGMGYATTLAKVQGAELPALAICCDVLGVPAAGYVALSRVRREDDVIFLLPPRQGFFTPA